MGTREGDVRAVYIDVGLHADLKMLAIKGNITIRSLCERILMEAVDDMRERPNGVGE